MKCCICGCDIDEDFGNNPDPLCNIHDSKSICCDDCNMYVINARLDIMSYKSSYLSDVHVGDKLEIFYANDSDLPITHLATTGEFLTGIVTDIQNYKYFGDWGNFALTLEDRFLNLGKDD